LVDNNVSGSRSGKTHTHQQLWAAHTPIYINQSNAWMDGFRLTPCGNAACLLTKAFAKEKCSSSILVDGHTPALRHHYNNHNDDKSKNYHRRERNHEEGGNEKE